MGIYSPSDVRSAIAAKTLVPSFQRIVNITTGRIAGFEVLTRCLHPTLGAVLPDNFISVSEKLGLMGEITSQVAVKALVAASTLPNVGAIAINLTRTQFASKADLAQITSVAQELAFPFRRIIFEVSEDTVFRDPSAAMRTVRKLKEIGYRVALDHCGPRYSAFSPFHQMGFDIVKIDRWLTQQAFSQLQARKTVMTIIGTARSLGSSAIAMGIESKAQLTALQSTGCKLAEGYLFGLPVLAHDLQRLLRGTENLEDDQPASSPASDCQEFDSFESSPQDAAYPSAAETREIEPLVTWTEDLSVGIGTLDDDHKAIFAMLNQLHDGVHRGSPRENLEAAIEELVQCTMVHFDREEEYFERTSFPGAEAHRAEHEGFRRRIYSLQRRIESSSSTETLMEIFPPLKAWLTGHVSGSDQLYRSHLTAHGIS